MLDVGGTKTLVAAVADHQSQSFRTVGQRVRFATPRDPGAFLDAVEEAALAVLPPGVTPSGIGIGAPGPLDPGSGIVDHSANLGWYDLPLERLVSERFGDAPTRVYDDGNAGALGEAHYGAGRGADPFVFLTLGTGLGCGIVVGGRIVTGANGAAGEVGHLAAGGRDGPMCACRRRNCVEVWCSGAGLARRARATWPARRLPDGKAAPRDALSVIALARRGDPDAKRLVLAARRALAIGIASILSTIDPAVVSVGGSIGMATPSLVRSALREASSLVHRASGGAAELRQPELGDASVIAGAAIIAADASHGRK